MLFRLAYLAVTNALTLARLLPISDHDKDVEILALRHQIGVLQRHSASSAFESNLPTGPSWRSC